MMKNNSLITDMMVEEVHFKVVREPWIEYQIEDGTIVKFRYLLKKLEIKKWTTETEFEMTLYDEVIKMTWNIDPIYCGKPDLKQYTTEEMTFQIEAPELDFNLIKTNISSEYILLTSRGKLKFAVIIEVFKASRTGFKDENGKPKYLFEWASKVNISKTK